MAEKQLKYFSFAHNKTTNLGKMYLLTKIHRRLFNVLGRPVIFNCGMPAEKVLVLLDSHLKGTNQGSRSYIKDSNDFKNKKKNLKDIPKGALPVTTDLAG